MASPNSVPLHAKPASPSTSIDTTLNGQLPQIIQTPSGLALLELQGKINFTPSSDSSSSAQSTAIGRLAFPDWDPAALVPTDSWMKRVFLFVGPNQRLTGEVKKLPKPVAVVRRRGGDGSAGKEGDDGDGDGEAPEELEIAEVVKYKLIFSQRPEPVGMAE